MGNKQRNPAKVLCVDDHEPTLRLLGEHVKDAGFGALLAEDGQQALELARREKPDLIVADWLMPNMDGLELCRKIRETEELKQIFFIMLTGHEGTRSGAVALNAGADNYMTKPLRAQEFRAAIVSGLKTTALRKKMTVAQRALFRAEKMASLGIMAGGIAHEFNNIFGAIVGYCELALEYQDPERTRKAIQVTLESAERAAAITKNLLGFARRQGLTTRAVDLSDCADKGLEILGPSLRRRNISVVKVVSEEVGPVKGDSAQLQQVIFNLAQNAQHAMESGGTLTVNIGRSARERYVEVRITDTGIGIAEENLPRIFEPFFTTKGAYGGGSGQGTGLGLSVVHGIVEAHGGSVSVSSREGEGTCFAVELPLWPEEAPQAAPETAAPSAELAGGRDGQEKLTVLAVDDEEHILGVLTDMLESFGHSVDVASSANQAIGMFKRDGYDLVFADIKMPGKSGWELLEELRGIDPDVPVVFVTGSIGEGTTKKALERGAIACVHKPFHMQEIKKVLSDFSRRYSEAPVAIRVMAEMDPDSCEIFLRQILPGVERSERDLELNMADVGYLRSCAIGFILELYREVSGKKRRLILSNVSEHAYEVLNLAGIAGGHLESLVVRRKVYDGQRSAGGRRATS